MIRITRLSFVLIITVIVMSSTAGKFQVQAATPSPSPSPKTSPTPPPSPSPIASPTAETNEKLKARIEKIVQNAIDKVKTTTRGYVAQVARVTAETITVQNKKGTQIISLTPDVSLVKKGKAITVDDLSVGDWAVVIGKQQDDAFAPELINISSVSLEPSPHTIALGKVSSVTKTGFNFTALNQSAAQPILFAKTSQILDNEANPLTYKQIPEQAQVLLVAIKTDKGWELQEVRLTSPLTTK